MDRGKTWQNAIIGAIVTLGLAFTGISPLLGGGVAGYLQRESPKRGATVGAIAGVLATIPLVLVMALGYWYFAAVPAGGPMPGGIEVLLIVFMLGPFLLVWFVGLAAVGGFLGAVIRGEYERTSDSSDSSDSSDAADAADTSSTSSQSPPVDES